MKSAAKQLELVRYAAEWMNNSVGVSDKVIPPWTPSRCRASDVGVWNRTLSLGRPGHGRAGDQRRRVATCRADAAGGRQGRPEIEIRPGDPKLGRHVEAEADFTGTAEAAGLRLAARTHVEFDGFVNVRLDVAPAGGGPATVDRLFLEIALPAEEATHFCTTAGGWSAVHDALPDHWTSRATSSGMLVGDFVPYVWLTNSDRALLWFADHDKGWSHEPGKGPPTQETVRKDGKVYLRINFFAVPTEVKGPRTITWGWQTFPSRPLPPGWRATFCAPAPPTPHTRNTYFWCDADWAVLWPYYCSPFPWHMDKSKALLDPGGQGPAAPPLRRLDRPLDRSLPGLRREPVSRACGGLGRTARPDRQLRRHLLERPQRLPPLALPALGPRGRFPRPLRGRELPGAGRQLPHRQRLLARRRPAAAGLQLRGPPRLLQADEGDVPRRTACPRRTSGSTSPRGRPTMPGSATSSSRARTSSRPT